MSQDVVPDVLGIAFVIESSLAVADEWRRILTNYVSQILRRLNEMHTGYRLRVAIVTYGSADTLPSPLLCKRFFVDYQQIVKELKDQYSELGLGQTNSGGSRGMAALEGLAAAVELFDMLKTQPSPKESSRPSIYHLFHIAASLPDAAKHPLWNVSPSLDNLSWDTLPDELKKRNIYFSLLCLQLPAQRFSELLNSANVSTPTNPWFQVHPPHFISLSGFAVSQQQKATKRIGEPQTNERPLAEAKRPRLTDISPKLPPANTSTNLHVTAPPAPITQTQSLPAPINPPQPPHPANVQMHKLQQLREGLRAAEERRRQLEISIKSAENEGNKDRADALRQEYNKLKEKIKQAMSMFAAQAQARQQAEAHAQSQASSMNPTAMSRAQSSPGHTQKESIPGTGGTSNDSAQTSSNLQPPQVIHNRTLSGSNFPQQLGNSTTLVPQQLSAPTSGNARMPVPGNVEAQMQKLLEQRQRNMGSGFGISQPVPNVSHPEPGSMSNASTAGPSSTLPLNPPFQTNEPPPVQKPPSATVWKGLFTWSGTAPSGKKEIRANVYASSNAPNCRPETWPSVFTLVPTKEQAVDVSDLREWMKRHKPALCTFHPDITQGEGNMNDSYYRMLVQLLLQRRIYATAAWTLPSGAQENGVLIFPLNTGLIGAFFPLTGIPEMPRPVNAPSLIQPPGLPPHIIAQLQQLKPEQRQQVMNQLMQQKLMQMRQTELAQLNQNQGQVNPLMVQHSGHDPSAAGRQTGALPQPNYGGMIGLVGTQGGSNGTNMMNLGPGHVNNIASGMPRPMGGMGVPGGNYDMLQSFMQRNNDSTM